MPIENAIKMRQYRERKKTSQTEEEKNLQRELERERKQKQRRMERIKKQRITPIRRKYTIKQALRRGVAGAKDPLIKIAPSPIHNIGVFACVPLVPGDIVTLYDGDYTIKRNSSESLRYLLSYQEPDGTWWYVHGLEEETQGRGLGSLINRVVYQGKLKLDNPKLGTRNCKFINNEDWTRIFVQITKKISVGEELVTTYGRNIRLFGKVSK